jgi:glucose-1-phosphate adenylyltransferase
VQNSSRARPRLLALILAGGAGGRLELLTDDRAKPATPFGGVYRLIDFPLSNCVHSGISDVWVAQQFHPHSLLDHLSNGRPWDLDRTFGGMLILHPHLGTGDQEGFYRGNADAIYRHGEMIRSFDPDLVLVLSADHVYRLDYRDVVDRHRESGAEVTIVTTDVAAEEASRFGNVRAGDDGRVTEFAYKPDEPLGETVTAEVFLYNAPLLLDTLDELSDEGDDDALSDFGDELLPRLVNRGHAYAFPLDGYWRDVGTVESYVAGHRDLLGDAPALDLDDERWPIMTYSRQRPPARVAARARVDASLVSPGCEIAGTVERSVLAPGVRVAAGDVVRDAVVLHDVAVAPGATVAGAVVDRGVRIGDGATVGGAGAVTLIGQDAVIAAGEHVAPGARRRR